MRLSPPCSGWPARSSRRSRPPPARRTRPSPSICRGPGDPPPTPEPASSTDSLSTAPGRRATGCNPCHRRCSAAAAPDSPARAGSGTITRRATASARASTRPSRRPGASRRLPTMPIRPAGIRPVRGRQLPAGQHRRALRQRRLLELEVLRRPCRRRHQGRKSHRRLRHLERARRHQLLAARRQQPAVLPDVGHRAVHSRPDTTIHADHGL